MRMKQGLLITLLLGFQVGAPTPVRAVWDEDAVPLCTALHDQEGPCAASDGSGGAVFAWQDLRAGGDIHAQRIDASGEIRWGSDGLPVCTEAGTQYLPDIAPDGAGGAIVAWCDRRTGVADIYAQRVTASGVVQWDAGGVPVCTEAASQLAVRICSDGLGGAIVAWEDQRDGNVSVHAQRLDDAGAIMWAVDGVPLCTASGLKDDLEIAVDGSGGAIVTWADDRTGGFAVYAQRVNATGAVEWTADGVLLTDLPGDHRDPTITPDGQGGALVAWRREYEYDRDIHVQQLDAAGTLQMLSSGHPVCTAPSTQELPRIAPDGAGGAIITWRDYRSNQWDIYAQRASASQGGVHWGLDGVPVCVADGDQTLPEIVPDGAGGALVVWFDERRGAWDVYAQRVGPDGGAQWVVDGLLLAATNEDRNYLTATSDGAGGAIAGWRDTRRGNLDVYAQLVDGRGRAGRIEPVISAVSDVPGDQGGWVNVAWDASPADHHLGEVTEYTVWRALATSAAADLIAAGAQVVTGADPAAREDPAAAGSAVLRSAGPESDTYYWELLSTVEAYRLQGYAKVSATRFDSTAVSTGIHHFQIIAHTSDAAVFWVSAPDSGYSVDNLDPPAPTGLHVAYGATNQLSWAPSTAPDIAWFDVHRAADPGFTPSLATLVQHVASLGWVDPDGSWGDHYLLVAVDDAGRVSDPAAPEEVSGAGGGRSPGATVLLGNTPNPFNPATRIAFDLNGPEEVTLTIYDVSGRRVRSLLERVPLPAGPQEVRWQGRDQAGRRVASGVYFCRLEAGGYRATSRMVLVK